MTKIEKGRYWEKNGVVGKKKRKTKHEKKRNSNGVKNQVGRSYLHKNRVRGAALWGQK